MQLRTLVVGDDAVSPVVGLILLVGITVVGTSASDNLEDATFRVVYSHESGDRTTTLVTWEGPDV